MDDNYFPDVESQQARIRKLIDEFVISAVSEVGKVLEEFAQKASDNNTRYDLDIGYFIDGYAWRSDKYPEIALDSARNPGHIPSLILDEHGEYHRLSAKCVGHGGGGEFYEEE